MPAFISKYNNIASKNKLRGDTFNCQLGRTTSKIVNDEIIFVRV